MNISPGQRRSTLRGFIERRSVVAITMLGAVAFLLGGCAGGQGLTGSITLSLVGLWLAGISLMGLLAGCGTGGGSLGQGSPLTDNIPHTPPTPTPTPTPTPVVAVNLRFVQQPTKTAGAQVNTLITPSPQVEAVDGSGTRVASFTGPITIALGTAPAGAVITGTLTRNAVAGVATFDDLRISIAGNYTLQASSGSLQAGTSVSFVTTPLPVSFKTQSTYNTSTGPYEVAVGDVNLDGKLDIVNSSYQGQVAVLLGNGDGTFKTYSLFPAGSIPRKPVIADLNGDGKPDIVVSNYGTNNISILMGNGDGTFQTQSVITTGNSCRSAVVADVNLDGKPDIVSSNFTGKTLSVLLGNGNGTFQGQRIVSTGSFGPSSAIAADVNLDGKPDIVTTAPFSQSILVLLGNGDGSFQGLGAFKVGNNPFEVVSTDVNGDGKPDIVNTNAADGTISVLLGNGDGNFKTSSTFTVGGALQPVGVSTADVNLDGKPDIITANYTSSTISVMLGNGDGTFPTQSTFAVGNSPIGVASADLNGDGKTDIITANYNDSTISVLLHD